MTFEHTPRNLNRKSEEENWNRKIEKLLEWQIVVSARAFNFLVRPTWDTLNVWPHALNIIKQIYPATSYAYKGKLEKYWMESKFEK